MRSSLFAVPVPPRAAPCSFAAPAATMNHSSRRAREIDHFVMAITLRRAVTVRRGLLALHESRRRQGERELRRYADLVDYAHAHPLAVDD